jgi:hypothetical protein
MPSEDRSYVKGNFAVDLDGLKEGIVQKVEGGDVEGEVAEIPPAGDTPSRRDVSRLRRPLFLILFLTIMIVVVCLIFLWGVLPTLTAGPAETEQPTEAVAITDPPPVPTTDEPTEVVITEEPGDLQVGDGACLDRCDPAASNCQAGLSCVPNGVGSEQYVCFNSQICQVVTEGPGNTDGGVVGGGPTEPPAECSAGWLPGGGCVCCGSTLVCADGTVAQFNPQCMGGPDTGYCGDGICTAAENVCGGCSIDCGPC